MRAPLPATAVALLALTACQQKTETVSNTTSVENKAVAAAPPLALPSIKGEASLRCHGDNSLIHVTFFEGDTQVSVQAPSDAAPVVLKAAAAGQPYVADGGWELSGTAKEVKLTAPGKPAQTCSA